MASPLRLVGTRSRRDPTWHVSKLVFGFSHDAHGRPADMSFLFASMDVPRRIARSASLPWGARPYTLC